MQRISVEIKADDVVNGLQRFEGALELANTSAVARIRQDIQGIINEGLEFAFEESGLHPIYQAHLRIGIQTISPIVTGTSDGLLAEYFDIEGLGTEEDLYEGYHYKAILAIEDKSDFSVSNPPRVTLPYAGEDLYNDFAVRYAFWITMTEGQVYEVTFGGGISPKTGRRTPSHTKEIDTSGMLEETLRARVIWWGSRYPEWLLLEYGQEYEPVTPPTHFKDLIEQRVREYMEEIYEEILDSIVQVWDSPSVSINSVGRLIDAKSGRFVSYLPKEE